MKRREDGSENNNFWVSFADLITLLMAFFVFMFSISDINTVKLLQVTDSLKQDMANESVKQEESKKLQKLREEKKKLEEMNTAISQYIKDEQLDSVLSVNFWDDRLELNMGNALLFEVGDSALRDQAQNVLTKMGEFFVASNSKIIVEGHSDNSPISTEQFPSNWELSSARAAAVVRYLNEAGVKPDRFVVIGYNQYMPLAPNDSETNKAKNRRVKIILKPDLEALKLTHVEAPTQKTHEGI